MNQPITIIKQQYAPKGSWSLQELVLPFACVVEPISSPKGGDMRQDKKMARICVKFSLAAWATFFF
jgi:hypothetical protein